MNGRGIFGTCALVGTSLILAAGVVPARTALAGGEHCRAVMEREAKGPPMVCHPLVIGTAKSLPFGNGAFDASSSYKHGAVVKDALALLKAEKSPIVRMETLRRATVYIEKDRALATELLGKLAWRAMDSEAAGTPDAGAWFDAAYLAGCYGQMGVDVGCAAGESGGILGYAWMQRALVLAENDSEMELGAALMTVPAMHKHAKGKYDAHVRRAAAGAKGGSLLEVNLANHLSIWGSSLEKVRAEAKGSDAGVASREKKDAHGGD